MPVVNAQAREVAFKIVYYGPGLGGKTTSLQHIHITTKPEHRGKMVSLATPVDRTLYFDFLPIRVPSFKDLTVRLQLFTVPGQVYYNATRKLVLTGADGIVFVADSQRSRVEASLESLRNLQENLEEQGRRLDEMPHVLQYNKRDLPDLMSIEELEQRINTFAAPSFASVASSGEGVYEALEAITRAVVEDFERRMPEHRELVSGQLTVPEGGLAEALRLANITELGTPKSSYPASSIISGPVTPPARNAEVTPIEVKTLEDTAQVNSEPDTNPGVGPIASRIVSLQREQIHGDSPQPPGSTVTYDLTVPKVHPKFSLGQLWPLADRDIARSAESALSRRDWVTAVSDSATLVERTLITVARECGEGVLEQSPAVCCILLGIEGRKYLEYQRIVSAVRRSCMPSEHEAVQTYLFAITVRQARAAWASE